MPRQARDESFIIKSKNTTCWEWPYSLDTDGYGRRGSKRAFKYFFRKFRGDIPAGMILDHVCFNRTCVNPDHLNIVTPLENRRRQITNKLKKEDIPEIKNLCKIHSQKYVAQMYNVHPCHISRIVNNIKWKGV